MAQYRIVPERSQVWIEARSSLHPLTITADGLEGEIDLALDGGEVDLDVAPSGWMSLPVARLTAGSRLEDHELRRRIDSRRHPTIDGVLTCVASLGRAGTYQVSGDVVFHGVTRNYKDEMQVEQVGERMIRLSGRSTFDLRDFGMDPPRVLFVRFEPQVEVRVDIVALKAEES